MYQFNTVNPAIIAQNRSIIKAFLRKPVILLYALLSLCGLGLSVSNLIINIPVLKELSAGLTIDLYNIFDKNSTVYVDTSATDISYMVTAVITAVIGLLFVAPLFMIFFKSLSKKHESSPSAGLTILKVLEIIGVILISFSLLCVLIFSLVIILAMISEGVPSRETVEIITGIGTEISASGQTFFIGVTVLLSVLVLALIFVLIWTISQLRFICSLLRGINTTKPLKASGALPIAVFSIIFSISSAFSLFSTLTLKQSLETSSYSLTALIPKTYNVLTANADFSSTYFIFMVASTAVSLLTYVLTFIIAIMYRKHIKRAKANPTVYDSSTSSSNDSNGGYYGDSYSNKDTVSAPVNNAGTYSQPANQYSSYTNTYSQPTNPYNSYTGTYNQPDNSNNGYSNAYNQQAGSYSTMQSNYYNPQPETETQTAEAEAENITATEAVTSDPAESVVTNTSDNSSHSFESSTPATYYCENCGKPYTDGDSFCENCGSKLR